MKFDPEVLESESMEDMCSWIRETGFQHYGSNGYSRIVFTNGCFDILHEGHLKLLRECKKLAGPRGAVVVGVNSDASIKRIKGDKRPINNEKSRCMLLISLKFVDHVTTFDEDTPENLITTLKPDVIVKGGDYKPEDVVGNKVAPVIIVPIVEGVSTTEFIRKIKENE